MQSITVQTTINAPIEKVWKHWTEPAHIKNWAFASDDWGVGDVSNDVTVGGKFSTIMAAKDGSASFDFGGVYTAVEQYKQIAYTIGDGRTVTIDFASDGDKTTVTETFEMEGTNSEEKQRGGWQAILENFKKEVETSNE
jgi:uncharacterized protein YndB with AHSA1/START domain